MPYTLVTWANLDTITEQKLDEMRDNEDYVREEASGVRVVFSMAGSITRRASTTPVGGPMGFAIGGLTLNSGGGGTGTSWADITGSKNWNVGALAKNSLQLLTVRAGNATGVILATVPVWIHEDLNFLSIWARTAGLPTTTLDGTTGFYLESLTVLGSRIDKGFTP